MFRQVVSGSCISVLLATLATAQTPAGGEFQVNTYTTGGQDSPAVGMAPDGRFVIAWRSQNIDGSGDAVAGQRYAAPGTPQGANFQVNSYTTGNQDEVAVAVARDGSFVVVWESPGQDGSAYGAFGQRYAASGSRLGSEFQVNTFTTNDQGRASVAIAPNKTFVVVWASNQVPGGRFETFAQRFDAAGARIGGEFQVNTYTSGYQIPVRNGPALAVDAGGNFVVVWISYDPVGPSQDGSLAGIFGQRFSAAGTRLGGEFQVNTYTTGFQYGPTVAMASSGTFDGNFVVAWESAGQDGSGYGVFGQRFNASGTRAGAEFRVNTYTTNDQYGSTVTADARGNFVVSWQSYTPGIISEDVMARRFASDGNPRGADFRVNTYTTNGQGNASISSDAVGNFTVAWESYRQDGNSTGVIGQRFGGLQPAALAVDTTGNLVLEPGEAVDVRPSWRNVNGAAQTFSGTLTNITGPAGAVYAITDPVGNYGTVANNTTGPCTDCYAVSVSNPPNRPALHWDAAAVESILPDVQGQQKQWLLHVGRSFTDVPTTNPFYRFVETLLHHGVTGGCSGTQYCPAASTTREQMAVFVLVAKEGTGYVPPACTTPVFADVPASSPFCRWIEELARRAVVSGCGGGNYCPSSAVTREQMAVFVLRTLDPVLSPPACTTPMFADVPASSPFCRWIEELARRAVVTGCGGGNYCPTASVTREQMGVFISVTFALTLYGP
jgi:S-layer family protein